MVCSADASVGDPGWVHMELMMVPRAGQREGLVPVQSRGGMAEVSPTKHWDAIQLTAPGTSGTRAGLWLLIWGG